MTTFKDKKGRTIVVEITNGCAIAYHDGKEVGDICANDGYDIGHGYMMPPKLTGMNVHADYRRAGVGIKMLELLSEELGKLAPGEFNIGIGGLNAMTDEGEALTRAGQAAGYVLPFPKDENNQDDE